MIYLSTYNVAFSGSVVTDGDEDLGYSRAEDHTDEYSKSKMIAERAVLSANGAIPPRYTAEMCCRPQRCAQGTAAWPRSRSARLRSSASARVAICHVSCGSWSGGCSRWPSATRTPCRHRMPIRWPSAEPGPTHVIWTSHRTGCTWTIWSTPSAAPRAPSGRNPAPSAAGRTSSTTASR